MLMNLKELKEKYNLNIRGVIHIGAHFGQEYKHYLDNNIHNILFFEPVPKTYEKLCENIIISENVKVYNMALGNINGEIEMNIENSNEGQSSSILNPKKHLELFRSIKFTEKIKVKINRLDDLEIDFSHYNMINVDVQGYELEVFKGSIKTLNNIDVIYSEVNNSEVYENCARIEELDSFLYENNFNRIQTVWWNESRGEKDWGDAIYIKNNLLNGQN